MRTFGEDFRKDVEVNRLKLDEENEIQPSMYAYYAYELAEAKRNKDEANDALTALYAQKDIYYRRNPPDDIKVTESVIKSIVDMDSDILDQKERLRKADAELSMLYAAINSLDQRKSALDNLTKLHIKQYYNNSNVEEVNPMRASLNRRD